MGVSIGTRWCAAVVCELTVEMEEVMMEMTMKKKIVDEQALR